MLSAVNMKISIFSDVTTCCHNPEDDNIRALEHCRLAYVEFAGTF
jgi:hypothetical protein